MISMFVAPLPFSNHLLRPNLLVFGLIVTFALDHASFAQQYPKPLTSLLETVATMEAPRLTLKALKIAPPTKTDRKVTLTADFTPLDVIKRDAPLFLNILDNNNKPVARFCHHPLKPTHVWKPGTTVQVGPVTFPVYSHLLPGKYKLQLGFLSPARIDDVGLLVTPSTLTDPTPMGVHFHDPEFGTKYVAFPYSNENISDFIVGSFDLPEPAANHNEAGEELQILKNRCRDQYGRDRRYGIGTASSMAKIGPTTFDGAIDTRLRFALCRNEKEPYQFAIITWDHPLQGISLQVSDLRHKNKPDVISKNNIDCRRVEYVRTQEPNYYTEHVGWWPDPLVEIQEPFDVPSHRVQSIWVQISVPHDATSGSYVGQIEVNPSNAAAYTLELHVKVWDFSIPPRVKFKMGTHLQGKFPEEKQKAYLENLLDHHVNPMDLCRARYVLRNNGSVGCEFADKMTSTIQFCLDRGMNSLCIDGAGWEQRKSIGVWDAESQESVTMALGSVFEKKFGEVLPSIAADYEAYLRQHGWKELAYWELLNEPTVLEYPAVRRLHSLVARGAPGIKRVLKGPPPYPDLQGYVDIWCPLIGRFDERECRLAKTRGESVFWHICDTPFPPYPNLYVDKHGIEPRLLFWMAWKYGVDGLLYWSPNFRGKPGAPWEVTQNWRTINGEGCLIYPGANGPVDTIRWENIRDGIEDYEYFWMLDQALKNGAEETLGAVQTAKARKYLNPGGGIITNRCQFTRRPADLLSAREQVGDLLELATRQKQKGFRKEDR